MTPARIGKAFRKTRETDIKCSINLDESDNGKKPNINTGIGFFDHMLEQFSYHSGIKLSISAVGDQHIDAHHCVEDCGYAIGLAINQALGLRKGINRFASAYAVLDESLARAVIDIGSRNYLHFVVPFNQDRLGEMDCELFKEFFRAVCNSAIITLHLDLIRGENNHHRIESVFKAFALAFKKAIALGVENKMIKSTKGHVTVTH